MNSQNHHVLFSSTGTKYSQQWPLSSTVQQEELQVRKHWQYQSYQQYQ